MCSLQMWHTVRMFSTLHKTTSNLEKVRQVREFLRIFLCRVLNVKEKTCAAVDEVLVSHWPAAVHCHSVSIKI